jgi:iron complex outermembrane receptor protein
MNAARRISRIRLAVGLALGTLTATSGVAQVLEEVIVTARKTEESLQEVPVAVTAFTAEGIERRQIQSIEDVARFAPGLVFDKAFGRATERPVIRGQGNVLAGVQFGVEAGAAYFVDGIYYPGDIQSLDMSEVERVEVIRGPQSALYGRNTYSGAINFITRSPGDEFGGHAKASYDSDEQSYSLRLEGPIVSDKLGASLSLRRYDFDGQWRNELTGEKIGGEESNGISGVLEFTPTDDLRFRLRGSYSEDRDDARPFMFQDSSFNNCYPGTRSLAYYATSGSTNANQYFCGEIQPRSPSFNSTQAVTNPGTTPGVPAGAVIATPTVYGTAPGVAFAGVDRDLTLVSLLADWDIAGSGYVLTADGAWRDEDRRTGSDSDFTPVNLFRSSSSDESDGANTALDTYEDYSVELKLASPVDRDFRWMLGAFYYEQEQRLYDVNFRYPQGRSRPNSISDVFNKSVFALAEWAFTDRWSITVEGRYMEETKQLNDLCTGTTGCTRLPGEDAIDNPGFETSFSDEGTWTSFTPRVTLKYQATPDVNLYFVYAEGVKPGGFNGAGGLVPDPPRPEYDQETSDNFEFGMKSEWLDGRLLFNIAAYFIDAKDIQLTTPIVRTDGSPVTSVASNQGSGEVRGLEIESALLVTDNLTLGLNYSLADSEFTDGCDDFQWTLTSGGGNNALRDGPYDPTNPAAGGTNLNGQGDCSIAGKQFPLSAKNTASFTVDYRRPAFGDFEFFANGDVSYTDKRPVQVHNEAYVPSATLLGARLGLSSDHWTFAVYGRNLTDEDSVAVATRWFTQPYIGFSAIPIPGTTPIASAGQLAAAGLPAYPPSSGPSTGPNSVASYALPRGFFAMLRRERQIGLEVAYRF